MGNAEETSSLLLQVGETVRAILRRKSGLSLRDDDPRPENQEAVELVHDVILRLWERQSTTPGAAWDDLGSYAARVTYNAWSDHQQAALARHPHRLSLAGAEQVTHLVGYRVGQSRTQRRCSLHEFAG